MATYVGVVKKNDLAGGFWELEAEDGQRYQLRGGGGDLHKEGQRVSIEGKVDKGGFGIGMVGAYLDVASWTSR